MSAAELDADVCVVGGGPAGAALSWRLAGLGHRVVVVERLRFPRWHVGEALGPGIWPLLELLGARAAAETAGFAPAGGARIRWGAPERQRPAGARPGVVADRGAFDALLLARAAAAGARLLQPATAGRAIRSASAWELPIATAGGRRTVRARFVADASGRRRALGGTRVRTSPRTVALHATWRGATAAEHTRVEARRAHWLWGAPLAGGRFSAIAFLDPGLLRRLLASSDVRGAYLALLSDSALFRHLSGGELACEVSVCDATCYAAAEPIGMRSAKVGEAAFAIDPLSSNGVQTAIESGLSAGAAIHTLLTRPGDAAAALAYVRERQQHAVHRHMLLAAEVYGDCAAYGDAPFWRVRAVAPTGTGTVPAAAPARASLEQLLDVRVRLLHEATLRPAPCVVGDRVELQRALSHPVLDRPVAYLGGAALAPLLDQLDGARPLRDVVEHWDSTLAPGLAAAVAAWLAERGLLTPATSAGEHSG